MLSSQFHRLTAKDIEKKKCSVVSQELYQLGPKVTLKISHFLRRSSVGILLCKSFQTIEVLEGGIALFHLLSPSNLRLLLKYIKIGVIGRDLHFVCALI